MAKNIEETTEKMALRYKRGISFNTYLPSNKLYLKEEIERLAAEEKRSVSEYVILILGEFVDRKRKK